MTLRLKTSVPGGETLPMSATLTMAYFISAHGLGHAARATAVMMAIQNRTPKTHFHIFTQAPTWFFSDSLTGPHTCHPMDVDVGLVQRSPLEEDLPATLARLDARFPIREKDLDAYCGEVKALNCGLVICDIAAMGIAVAERLGLPSILVENFTWDWVYTHYPKAPQELRAHAAYQKQLFAKATHRIPAYQKQLFAKATHRIQAEPVCNPLPAEMTVPPVSRPPQTLPAASRQALGLEPGTPLVLITMGGTPATYGFLSRLQQKREICFLLPGIGREMRREGNLILLPARSDFRHPDLIAASNAVVGKVGYSTLAEIYHAGVPFGFVRRPHFPESAPLADYIEKHMPAREIAFQDFGRGGWISELASLLALPPRPPVGPNGADQIAAFVLARAEAASPLGWGAEPL
jgi:hypothetical protein